MRIRTLHTDLWLPRPLADIFAFFSDAGNLDVLTPPWLHFRILTPRPLHIHASSRIEYRLRWHGLPIFWRTQITVWEPPHRFVDEQIKGPYALWRHEHTFEERDGGTLLRDRVDYAIPGFWLEPLVHGLVVGRDVRNIFAYRRRKMQELFPPS